MDKKEEFFSIINKGLCFSKNFLTIFISKQVSANTRFSDSKIQKNEILEETIATITVYKDKKKSVVKTNIITDEGIKDAINKAEENLSLIPNNSIGIPSNFGKKHIIYDTYDPNLYKKFNHKHRLDYIKKGIEILPNNFYASGTLSLVNQIVAIGNSFGIKRYGRIDKIFFNLIVNHISGSSGYIECSTNIANEMDILKLFSNAYMKAKKGISPVSMPIGTYTVILEPLAVSDLLSYMSLYCFSAKSVQNSTSFLTGKMNKQVFNKLVNIVDDISDKNTFYFPFDFEGYERKKLNIIQNGYLRELAYDYESAYLDRTTSSGHSINNINLGGYACNLVMTNGLLHKEKLIKSIHKGILVSRFFYIDILDTRKGLFSASLKDGAFLIEDGKITNGIKNMRITDTIENLFNNISCISKEREKVQNFLGINYVPNIKVNNVNINYSSN